MTSQEKSILTESEMILDKSSLNNFSLKNESEFNKQQKDRKAKYDKMISHLSKYDDWQKYKFLIPPFVELTYDDYIIEEKHRRTGQNNAQEKEPLHIDKPTEDEYITLD